MECQTKKHEICDTYFETLVLHGNKKISIDSFEALVQYFY